MQEQFVPYEIAEQLLNKYFNEDCLGYYQNKKLVIRDTTFYEVEKYNLGILAPLWQQVIDWFRKKYNIIIEVQFLGGLTKETAQYIFTVWVGEEYGIENDDSTQDWSNNYEEVRQKAIEHALTLI
jgi:hypothetical protein